MMSYDFRCSVAFLTVMWFGLSCVIVVFPDHNHFLFILIHSFKIQDMSGIGVIMQFLETEYRSCGLLTSLVSRGWPRDYRYS